MNRRDFVLLFGAVAMKPRAVLAEPGRPVVGYLGFGTKDAPAFVRYLPPFLNGMRELGYADGQNFEMLYRFADFHADRLPQLATELVQLKPDVFFAAATFNAVVLKKATDTIPIVVGALADPVELGLIESYAHPGRNVTGIMPYVEGLPTKQLELARELIAGATRIGLLDDVIDPKTRPQRQEIEAAGPNLKLKIIPAEVHTETDISQAYEVFAAANVEVVVVEQSNMLLNAAQVIAQSAAAKKLPTVYGYDAHVEAGGLISYGVNLDWCYHRVAYYIDKILKGAKPADLPVEFPTAVQLWINLKSANALGLKISRDLLVRADKVIE